MCENTGLHGGMMLTTGADQMSLTSFAQQTKSSASVRVLPEELYGLVRAGISNAIEQAISHDLMRTHESTVGCLEKLFMDEISGPSPQISQFIRNHEFIWSCSVTPRCRMKARGIFGLSSGSLQSAQRQYEQDVYNFSRNLGLPMDGADKWVLKAREVWSEKDYNSPDTEQSNDVSSWNGICDQSSKPSISEMFQLPLAVKDSRQAKLKAEKEATRQARKHKRRMEKHECFLENPEWEVQTTKIFEDGAQCEQLEDNDKPQRQKKKARKRKRDHELPQSELNSREHHKHSIARADSDPQGTNSRKSKTKKGGPQYSPFFHRSSGSKAEKDDASIQAKRLMDFQRNSEDAFMEAKQLMDFQTPMIQSA